MPELSGWWFIAGSCAGVLVGYFSGRGIAMYKLDEIKAEIRALRRSIKGERGVGSGGR